MNSKIVSLIALLSVSLYAFGQEEPPENIPPECELGEDISITAQAVLTPITLSPVTATDPDGDDELLSYLWSVSGESGASIDGAADGQSATVLVPVGETVVTLELTDESGAVSSCDIIVSVVLPAPPVIVCEVDPNRMWPPNHQMKKVAVTAKASSDVAASPDALTIACEVSSDEPDSAVPGDRGGDVNGHDGHASPVSLELENDSQLGAYVKELRLRSERLGSGDGRVYTIKATATDIFGQTGESSCIVFVPHDRSQGMPAMVDELREEQELRKERKRARRAALRKRKQKQNRKRKQKLRKRSNLNR
jgi:hypothetical protein